MSYRLLSTRRFQKELKRLNKKFPSLKSDFAKLIAQLKENPELGTSLGRNCFKIRLAISSKAKGKSGGARVITCVYHTDEAVYLLTIYDKGELSDVKPEEIQAMINSLGLDS